jgi:hypothetical protein
MVGSGICIAQSFDLYIVLCILLFVLFSHCIVGPSSNSRIPIITLASTNVSYTQLVI